MNDYHVVHPNDFTTPYSSEATYLALVNHVIKNGVESNDRTNTGTRSVFGASLKFDLSKGVLPALTTKYINVAAPKTEMDWMLSGGTNIKQLQRKGVRIWDEWADKGAIPRPSSPLHLIENKKMAHSDAILKINPVKTNDFNYDELLAYRDMCLDRAKVSLTAPYTLDIYTKHLEHTLAILCREHGHHQEEFKLLPNVENHYYGLSTELQDSDAFFDMFYSLDNRKAQRVQYLHLTSLYWGEQVLTKDNAKLVGMGEILKWIDADDNGYYVETLDLGMSNCVSTNYWFKDELDKDMSLDDLECVKHPTKILRHMASTGSLGPIYGASWRQWNKQKDQLKEIINEIKTNQRSRRHLLLAWNPGRIDEMNLPPCHVFVQYYAIPITAKELEDYKKYTPGLFGEDLPKYKLSLQVYFRSNDLGLGTPYNILNYSYNLITIALQANMAPGDLLYNIGDAHVYVNHIDGLKEQLTRTPKPFPNYEVMSHTPSGNDGVGYTELNIKGYDPEPAIRLPVAV